MIQDFDAAYENASHIPEGGAFPDRWRARAAAFRERAPGTVALGVEYGSGARQTVDLFYPAGAPRGLAVFVHGGYWMRFGPSDFSHLARAAVEAGWLAVVPGYTLAPNARVRDIAREVGQCLDAMAGHSPGPIRLAGHSAGGQIVARLACEGAPVSDVTAERIERVVSISGLADLRPLLYTEMRYVLDLDEDEAASESPAFLDPLPHVDLIAWVGANERPEFVRQNRLLATAWAPFVRSVDGVEELGRHHFDVIDGLENPNSPLGRAFVA